MIPMNNTMIALVNALKGGANPSALLQQVAAQNPQAKAAIQMISGKNSRQLEQIARNMARERGIDIEEFARSLGVTIPSER